MIQLSKNSYNLISIISPIPLLIKVQKNIHIKNKPESRPISYKIYITYRIVKTIIEINTPISANTL